MFSPLGNLPHPNDNPEFIGHEEDPFSPKAKITGLLLLLGAFTEAEDALLSRYHLFEF